MGGGCLQNPVTHLPRALLLKQQVTSVGGWLTESLGAGEGQYSPHTPLLRRGLSE